MPRKRKISCSKRGRKRTIAKKRETVKEAVKRELPGKPIKSEEPSIPARVSVEASNEAQNVDEKRDVYRYPQPTIPKGHKIIHILRHFRAWHK